MKNKLKVCLLFGGKSGEHEVSLMSAKSVFEALNKDSYEIFLVGINKKGEWLLHEKDDYLLNSNNPKKVEIKEKNSRRVFPTIEKNVPALLDLSDGKMVVQVDVFFLLTHGTYGEDGAVQGLLEMMNVAYVGAGILGSAIGMDKDIMKRLLREAGIPIGPFHSFNYSDISESQLDIAIQELDYPIFVKPANLGSSVGISKVNNKKSLDKAIEEAFQYDTKILLEKCILGREIECSVLGNDAPKASLPGEVIPSHDFYSYEAKYIDKNGAKLEIPAKLSDQQVVDIQQLAVKTFKVLQCAGMARVDFFLTQDNQLYVNEINTIPGFTKISMYPKLWEVSGISYSHLLDKLITLAVEKKQQKDSLKRSFT